VSSCQTVKYKVLFLFFPLSRKFSDIKLKYFFFKNLENRRHRKNMTYLSEIFFQFYFFQKLASSGEEKKKKKKKNLVKM